MATATGKNRCVTCDKARAIFKCGGCQQDFCSRHAVDHREELSRQLDEVEVTRDLFRQTLTDQSQEPQKNSLIQQIDKWERDSIKKIQRTAEEARHELLKYTDGHIRQIETELNRLTDQLRQSREENDFVETDLHQWKEELTHLTSQLAKPSHITIGCDSTPLVTKISVNASTESIYRPNIKLNTRWAQNGITAVGGNGPGNRLDQLNHPHGVCVDDEQTIYVADHRNHRIMEWKYGVTNGQVVAGGNGPGNGTNQLNIPTDVAIDKKSNCFIICDHGNRRVVQWSRGGMTRGQTIISDIACYGLTMDSNGCLYVSDWEKNEVKRWRMSDNCETVVAGGNGKGSRLGQLNHPTYLFIDEDHSLYVSDTNNHRVMKWLKGAKEGIVVAGGQGQGNSMTQLSNPYGVAVDRLGTVYVADYHNNRIMCWSKGATQGSIVIGGNGQENQPNQLNGPGGLSLDRQGNLYVADNRNHRVQKFSNSSS